MKKILSFVLMIFFFSNTLITHASKTEENYFVVTAYYSPLPDQKYYLTGDYELEKRLNGEGIQGAGGKKVFSGMLAAPQSYPFGTKIYLEGLGIGVVEDRGGAIVPAGERGYQHDRIDVWMGYGDEGLRRALYWGKRTVKGNIVSQENTVDLDYEKIPAPTWAIPKAKSPYKNIQIQTQKQLEKKLSLFETPLGKESSGEMVERLQEILLALGYLEEEKYSVGNYDTETISAVFSFQKNQEIVSESLQAGAGYFGPKTRKKLEEVYVNYTEEKEAEKIFFEKLEEIKTESYKKAESEIQALGELKLGDISPEVRKFQILLRDFGHFNRSDTAIFGTQTLNALIEYQLGKGIISSEKNSGAGIFGPLTREYMIGDLMQYYLKEGLEKAMLQEEYETRVLKKIEATNTNGEEGKSDISSLEKTYLI